MLYWRVSGGTPVPIRFTCRCGKTLEVDHILGGHDVRCPSCNATVRAPITSQTPSSYLNETPVEHIRAQIAEGLLRDRLSTSILVAAGAWFAILLPAMFIGALMQHSTFIMWLFIWLPLILLLEYGAYCTLTDSPWSRPIFLGTLLIAIGVSWTYLLLAVASLPATPNCASITFICSFLNLLFCLALLWQFGRRFLNNLRSPDISKAQPEEPSQPEPSTENPSVQ